MTKKRSESIPTGRVVKVVFIDVEKDEPIKILINWHKEKK